MPIPNPDFFASVPLQYVFRDKDTGDPLSAGVVLFFADPDFTVPKSVYQLTLLPDNTIQFVDIGNTLILSSIGTFVDDSGANLVPYYYPWTNAPESENKGEEELYFIKVYSSGGVLQFTLQEWPPNVGSGGSGGSGQVLSFNQITNPQFTVVNFIPDPTTGIYTYTTTGTMTVDIAPGWKLRTQGIGTISLKQLSLSDDIISEPPYALQIMSANTGGLSSVQLIQTITNSPRILASPENAGLSAISGYVTAASEAGTTATITMDYIPSDTGASQEQLFSKNTLSTGAYLPLFGSTTISTPISTADGSGYVDIVIDITVGTKVNISSVQLLQVENENVEPGFIQQSTQEQLSNMMWYYKPQLAYKPIPSYALGWDFAFNPGQQLGSSIAVSGLGNNMSRYIADQTIAFEEIGNVISYTIGNTGLSATTGTTSQVALIQYLPSNQAYELLSSPNLSVMIKGGFGSKGYVSLWWTTGSASGLSTTFNSNGSNYTSGTSLVTGLTDGIPTVAGTWTVIPNPTASIVGTTANMAAFDGTTSGPHALSGWLPPTTSSDIVNATYFAIVVSFTSIPTGAYHNINYITLNAGAIPTPPPPMNSAQTLQGLQFYYQKSFRPGVAPIYAVGTSNGEECFPQTSSTLGQDSLIPVDFYTPMIQAPTVNFYNPVASNGSAYNDSLSTTMGPTGAAFVDARKFLCSIQINTGVAGNLIMVNWTADARLGTY